MAKPREHDPKKDSNPKKGKRLSIEMARPATSRESLALLLKRRYQKEPQTSIPEELSPMLATSSETPFDDTGWQFELKWDGYRALAFCNKKKLTIRSRSNTPLTDDCQPIAKALAAWGWSALLDGELVVLNEEGKADFAGLQQYMRSGEGNLFYYVFDLLWLEGIDLRGKPLEERRALLKQVLPDSGPVRYSESIDEAGTALFKLAQDAGLEGIIAKKKNAVYESGMRSSSWLKIKAARTEEALICGYTRKSGSGNNFSSLVIGQYEEGTLHYRGSVDSGFRHADQAALLQEMKPIQIARAPFSKVPELSGEVVWVKPELVCEIRYTERTPDGLLRHAAFKGMRPDKEPGDLVKEKQTEWIPEGSNELTINIDQHAVKLTNLQKVLWPTPLIVKESLLTYYHKLAPWILPYIENRPQSLHRYPGGIEGKALFQKHIPVKLEPWIKTYRRPGSGSEQPKYYFVCTDEAHLLYLINLGCIELQPWHSTVAKPDHPSWCVIDLVSAGTDLTKLVEAALLFHQILEQQGMPSFPKTTARGLHIYIPLGQRYTYEQSLQLAESLVRSVHGQLPDTTSLERSPAKRPGMIYLDHLQNRAGQTVCAPYSVMPVSGAPVSAPLDWSEVNRKLRPEKFNMKNILERLHSEGDLFAGLVHLVNRGV